MTTIRVNWLLDSNVDKRASLDKARLLFPGADLGLVKHDGRAEALLIAQYALSRPLKAAA